MAFGMWDAARQLEGAVGGEELSEEASGHAVIVPPLPTAGAIGRFRASDPSCSYVRVEARCPGWFHTTRNTTMHREPFTTAVMQPLLSSSEWGGWDAVEAAGDSPALLVSPMFWLGGGMSLLLWGCATWLALAF